MAKSSLGNMFGGGSKNNSKLNGPTGVDDILSEINNIRSKGKNEGVNLDDVSSDITTSSKRSANRRSKTSVLDLNI